MAVEHLKKPKTQAAMTRIGNIMANQIAPTFQAGALVTVIVRFPGEPECDFFMSDRAETLAELRHFLDRCEAREGIEHDTEATAGVTVGTIGHTAPPRFGPMTDALGVMVDAPAAWMHEFKDPHTGERRCEPRLHKPKDFELLPGDTVRPLVYADGVLGAGGTPCDPVPLPGGGIIIGDLPPRQVEPAGVHAARAAYAARGVRVGACGAEKCGTGCADPMNCRRPLGVPAAPAPAPAGFVLVPVDAPESLRGQLCGYGSDLGYMDPRDRAVILQRGAERWAEILRWAGATPGVPGTSQPQEK